VPYNEQPSVSEYIEFFTERGFELFDITLNKALRTYAPRRSDFFREKFGIYGLPSFMKGRVMDGDLLFLQKAG